MLTCARKPERQPEGNREDNGEDNGEDNTLLTSLGVRLATLFSHVSWKVPEIRASHDSVNEQGRIHGYLSRVWMGRGSDVEGQICIWAGAVMQKPLTNAK